MANNTSLGETSVMVKTYSTFSILGEQDLALTSDNSSANSSANSSVHGQPPCCQPSIERFLIPAIFCVVVILGCLGNTLVVIVVLKNRDHFRNTTNLFILNLAIADMLFLIFCVPFHAIVYTVPDWPFGDFMCKFVHLVQYSSMVSSILTLVAMSLDRYLAVGHPIKTKHLRTPWIALFISVITWLIAITIALPWPIVYTVRVYHNHGPIAITVCADDWGGMLSYKPTYFLLLFIFTYALPLFAIFVLSVLMIHQLWVIHGPASEGIRHRQSLTAKRKVTRLIIVVVLVFGICWLPKHICWLWINYFPKYVPFTYTFYYWSITTHILSYANSSMNPVIYAFLSSQFRKGFHKALRCTGQRITTKYRFSNMSKSLISNASATNYRVPSTVADTTV